MYQLTSLGDLSVHRDGRELSRLLSRKYELALLVYLAVEGAASRDSIISVFWPEKEEEKARHSLSQTLYQLRQQLGNGCLEVSGDRVSVDVDHLQVDAVLFEAAVQEERWSDAVNLSGGEFLPGFYLKSPGFESWLEMQRSRLTRLRDRAFSERIGELCSAARVGEAAVAARRWVGQDPLSDQGQRYLIELLALAGRPSDALRQYERYVRRLRREFDVGPPERLRSLIERIRSGEVGPAEASDLEDRVLPVQGDTYELGRAAKDTLSAANLEGLADQAGRRVVQVVLAYIGFAWILIEMTKTYVDEFRLSQGIFVFVTILAVIGLPLVLFLVRSSRRSAEGAERPDGRGLLGRLRMNSTSGRVITALVVVTVALIATRAEMKIPDRLDLETTVLIAPQRSTSMTFSSSPNFTPSAFSEALDFHLDGVESLGLKALDGSALDVGEVSSPEEWFDVATAMSAKYVLTSRVVPFGDSVEAMAELYRADGDRVFKTTTFVGRTTELNRLANRAALQVYSALAEREGWPMVDASPDRWSPAAWPQVTGMQYFRQADFDRAIGEFRRAISADTGFARAYLHLALAEYWHPRDPTGARMDSSRKALAAALDRQKRLSIQALYLARAYEAYLRGHVSGALRRYERAREHYPDNDEAWLGLAETYHHLGPYAGRSPHDARVAWDRLLRVDTAFAPAYYHLTDLAFLADDTVSAHRYLDRFLSLSRDTAGARQAIMRALVAMAYGEETERERVLDDLPPNFWELIKQLVRADRLGLADSVAARMTLATRTAGERQRGHEYRFVILVGGGRYEEALQQWRAAVRAGENPSFNPWVVMAYLAGHPYGRIVRPMLRAAEEDLVDSGWPDPTLPVTALEKKRFRGLVQHAALRGDSALVARLRERLPAAIGDGYEVALIPAYQNALDARLALLAHDSTAAAAALERSLDYFPEPLAAFLPTTVLAPQRLILARLLLAEGDVRGALGRLDSFEWSLAIVDVFFREEARALKAEILRDYNLEGR